MFFRCTTQKRSKGKKISKIVLSITAKRRSKRKKEVPFRLTGRSRVIKASLGMQTKYFFEQWFSVGYLFPSTLFHQKMESFAFPWAKTSSRAQIVAIERSRCGFGSDLGRTESISVPQINRWIYIGPSEELVPSFRSRTRTDPNRAPKIQEQDEDTQVRYV